MLDVLLRVAVALTLAVACLGAEKKLPAGKASNSTLEISATLYTDKSDIKRLLGNDLDGYYTIVEVRLAPRSGGKLAVVRDDFLLRSDKDGQRTTPFHPSQIAGGAALVVSSTGAGGIRAENPGPIWGPPLGGPPRRMGTDPPVVGNSPESTSAAASTVTRGGNETLLETLKRKVLPEQDTSEPLTGLLYFFLDGSHKPKDLELLYRGPAGKLSLRFKD